MENLEIRKKVPTLRFDELWDTKTQFRLDNLENLGHEQEVLIGRFGRTFRQRSSVSTGELGELRTRTRSFDDLGTLSDREAQFRLENLENLGTNKKFRLDDLGELSDKEARYGLESLENLGHEQEVPAGRFGRTFRKRSLVSTGERFGRTLGQRNRISTG